MFGSSTRLHRRRWPLISLIGIIGLAALWVGLWHYAAGVAEQAIDGWKAREARSGRVYRCAEQAIGGFPFGIALNCARPTVAIKSSNSPLDLRAENLVVSARLWQPTVLTSELAGPLTVTGPGGVEDLSATWRSAQSEVRGLPEAPENVAIRIDGLAVHRAPDRQELVKAGGVELTGRLLSGTVRDRPVIEIILKLAAAAAPHWHAAAAEPVNADVTAVLRGLRDFSPKPWAARFRELQAGGGRIDIRAARVQQGEVLAAAAGILSLSPRGRLDGHINLTVVNLPQLLARLGLDRLIASQGPTSRLGSAFRQLDRIMPGLGDVARQNAGPMVATSLSMMGEPTTLEGKPAVTLPLRFSDGAVSLGPIPIGMTPPLF